MLDQTHCAQIIYVYGDIFDCWSFDLLIYANSDRILFDYFYGILLIFLFILRVIWVIALMWKQLDFPRAELSKFIHDTPFYVATGCENNGMEIWEAHLNLYRSVYYPPIYLRGLFSKTELLRFFFSTKECVDKSTHVKNVKGSWCYVSYW